MLFRSTPKVSVLIPGAPASVQSLVATPTDGAINFAWTPPTDTSTISQYKFEEFVSGNWVVLTQTGLSTTTFSRTGLSNGTQYLFRITTSNALGVGTPTPVSATPYKPSSAPNISSVSQQPGQLLAQWSAPSSNIGGLSLSGYVVEVTETATGNVVTVETATVSNGLSYTKVANNSSTYSVRVAALTTGAGSVAAPAGVSTPVTVRGEWSARVAPEIGRAHV